MKTPKFLPGDFYAQRDEERNVYKLYRILITEPTYGAIHIALYSNRFSEIPSAVNMDELSFSLMQVSSDGETTSIQLEADSGNTLKETFSRMTDDKHSFGIMHLPMSMEGFDADDLHFVDHEPLEETDLEGFKAYLEGTGYPADQIEEYVAFVLDRSGDRGLFALNDRLKWMVPALVIIFIGVYLMDWVHGAVAIIGLLLLGLLSVAWWGRLMRNMKAFYEG